jgi:hypothetical protein
LTPIQARDGLQKYSLYNTPLSQHCPKVPVCKINSKYRTIDGSCNNLDYPLWGKSLTQFTRLVPPAYADGLNELRRSVDGGPLPGPREVSCKASTSHSSNLYTLIYTFMYTLIYFYTLLYTSNLYTLLHSNNSINQLIKIACNRSRLT